MNILQKAWKAKTNAEMKLQGFGRELATGIKVSPGTVRSSIPGVGLPLEKPAKKVNPEKANWKPKKDQKEYGIGWGG